MGGEVMGTEKSQYGNSYSDYSHSFAHCIFPKGTSSSSRANSVHFPWVLILHAKVPGNDKNKQTNKKRKKRKRKKRFFLQWLCYYYLWALNRDSMVCILDDVYLILRKSSNSPWILWWVKKEIAAFPAYQNPTTDFRAASICVEHLLFCSRPIIISRYEQL